jgi:hypothetical protein
MRKIVLAASSAALLVLLSGAALADCLEEAEGYGLAAQQKAGGEIPVPVIVKDPSEQTPVMVGITTYGPQMGGELREAIMAARAGNEEQCRRMLDAIQKAQGH